MAVSNRTKRNISLVLTVLGAGSILARIIDPIMNRTLTGWNVFEIFSAIVITCCAFNLFNIYRKRVSEGIMFGKG